MKNEETNRSGGGDDLESRIRAQRLTELPAAWRSEILSAARQAADTARTAEQEPIASRFTFYALLHQFFGTHPKAWAGLAAAWLVILGLNYSSNPATPTAGTQFSDSTSTQMRSALKEKQVLLAELAGRSLPVEADRPKPAPARPHSQRREEMQMA